jgi:hypothetical protein
LCEYLVGRPDSPAPELITSSLETGKSENFQTARSKIIITEAKPMIAL